MTKLFVTVKPNAKENRVEVLDAAHFSVRVKAPPDEGRANEAVIQTLSAHLGIPPSRLSLLRGRSSKHKIFEIKA